MPRSVTLDDFVHGDSITVVTETGEELVVPVEHTSADCEKNSHRIQIALARKKNLHTFGNKMFRKKNVVKVNSIIRTVVGIEPGVCLKSFHRHVTARNVVFIVVKIFQMK